MRAGIYGLTLLAAVSLAAGARSGLIEEDPYEGPGDVRQQLDVLVRSDAQALKKTTVSPGQPAAKPFNGLPEEDPAIISLDPYVVRSTAYTPKSDAMAKQFSFRDFIKHRQIYTHDWEDFTLDVHLKGELAGENDPNFLRLTETPTNASAIRLELAATIQW
jgi:hypothetical protein